MAGVPHSGDPVATRPSAARLRRPVGPYHVLAGNRDLLLLILGRSLVTLGTTLYEVALTAAAYLLTHSAAAVAALTFVRLLPSALFLTLTGSLVDRVDRRRLMAAALLGQALCVGALLLAYGRGALALAVLCVFATAALSGPVRPAITAVLPSLATMDDLVAANSVMSQADSVGITVGPLLGGVLVLLGTVQGAFAGVLLCYLLAAVVLGGVRVPARESDARVDDEGPAAQVVAGVRFLVRENAAVLAVLTLAVMTLTVVGGAYWTFAIVLCETSFRLGPQGIGFLSAAYGAGCIAGGLVASATTRRWQTTRPFIAAATGSALLIVAFGFSPAGPLPFIVMAVNGVTDVIVQVTATTVLQRATPGDLLGRVSGAYEAALILAMLLGALLAGPLVGLLGARGTTIALAALALSVLGACIPRLLRLEEALGLRLFLRQAPLFNTLSRRALDALGAQAETLALPAGTAIVTEGEPGDHLYLIKEGDVEVLVQGTQARPHLVRRLYALDYFGEIALLQGGPRTATVRSHGPVVLLRLSRAAFQEMLAHSPELRAAVQQTGAARYQATHGAWPRIGLHAG